MSEYVVDLTDGFLGEDVDLYALFGPRLHEKVLRCMDCGGYVDDIAPNDPEPWHYCKVHGSDKVGPDGFCKWWRAKDDEE